ncbi:ATP-binding protein [Flavobacterium sp. LHD-85]|uniref:tetratricopeptide repeat-containing sensor histidine kinase n=1 Tax=Flavobacterium sp. LHD-85 TaxID=3071410 RepID=UPI0027E01004|nr:ATP-binding protein [Flavobacterium sp. LHD-85]MDQ6531859.1 ATP-binding protein [Flavobacterium sp. LHD-85]
MADIQLNHGDHIGSETTITDAIPYLKSIKDQTNVWNIYTTLGTNYLRTYNLNDALLYYNKALGLKVDESRKSLTKSNIATVLLEQQKYDEALQIFLRLSTQKELQQKPEYNAKNIDNIGLCYNKMNDPKGIQYLNHALEIRKGLKNISGIGTSNFHIAKYYDETKNYVLAKKHAQLSYESYTKANSMEDRLNALALIIKNSNGSELKKNSLLYVALVDSAFEVRQRAKNKFAKIKYDSKSEKEENLKLRTQKAQKELQIEKQKNKNIISYLIIILSVIIIFIIYYYLTSKVNKEKIEATYRSETRIAKKLHDELANDIYHTIAFTENKNLSIAENKDQLMRNLDAIYTRTRDISKENNPISTDQNYVLHLKQMISEFSTPDINLMLNGLNIVSWDAIDQNKKEAIYRILQELLVNMKKHSNATLVSISFKKVEKYIIVNYNDNGKGIDAKKITFKNGLHNIESRITKIRGEISFDSLPNKGFKATFKFPS